MLKRLNRTRLYIRNNKTKILGYALLTSTAVTIVQHREIKAHDSFLRKHGLFDEYYKDDQ